MDEETLKKWEQNRRLSVSQGAIMALGDIAKRVITEGDKKNVHEIISEMFVQYQKDYEQIVKDIADNTVLTDK